jgi:DivIVA domain-containing protein
VDLDRQTIERRDFPIGRRGYDPAAVDAHLRALATEVEELQRAAAGPAADSLAATAGTQVQGIIQAAETAAAEIESQARASAKSTLEQAETDARKTRADAVSRAQAHVAAVSESTATLRQRVESMDGEASGLVDSLRAGAGRLAGDLSAVETNMGELYDAASGGGPSTSESDAESAQSEVAVEDPRGETDVTDAADFPLRRSPPVLPTAPRAPSPPLPEPAELTTARPAPAETPAATNGDLDGARLIALNMALNGESREDVGRYLADHFQLGDRQKLIDDVYAAIEG